MVQPAATFCCGHSTYAGRQGEELGVEPLLNIIRLGGEV